MIQCLKWEYCKVKEKCDWITRKEFCHWSWFKKKEKNYEDIESIKKHGF